MGGHNERYPSLWWDASGAPAKGTLLALAHECDPDKWRARRCAEHLSACERAYRAGVMAAVSDAMLWCEAYDCTPPRWLCEAIAELVDLRTTDAERRERREAMLHYDRYDRVHELLE